MTEETDTELSRRWDRLQANISRLKQGDSTAPTETELESESGTIKFLWEGIVLRKRRGDLTDFTRIDAIKKVISDLCLWHDFKIRFKLEECPRQPDDAYSRYWTVTAIYAGKSSDLDIQKWRKLVTKIIEELTPFQFVFDPNHPSRSPTVFPEELPDDYWDKLDARLDEDAEDDEQNEDGEQDDEGDDQLDEENEEWDGIGFYDGFPTDDPYKRPAAMWTVNTWVWDGPPEPIKKRRQRN
jgi:hypothetical protein